MKKKLSIIDADGLIFYAAYQFRDQLSMVGLAGATKRIDDIITKILNKTGCHVYIGFFGQDGVKNFRHEWATEKVYKGARKPEDWHLYYRPKLKEHFKKKWKFMEVGLLEADDAVIIAHHQFKREYEITQVGEDKDLNQLGEFLRYNPKKHEFVSMDHNTGRNFFWGQMIMGDSTDGIGGIAGQGKKSPYITALTEMEDQSEEARFEVVKMAYIHKYGADDYLYHMVENYLLLNMLNIPSFDYPQDVAPVNWNNSDKFKPELLEDL